MKDEYYERAKEIYNRNIELEIQKIASKTKQVIYKHRCIEKIQKEKNFQTECLSIIDELLDMRIDVKRFAESDGKINSFLKNRFKTIDKDIVKVNRQYHLSRERLKILCNL